MSSDSVFNRVGMLGQACASAIQECLAVQEHEQGHGQKTVEVSRGTHRWREGFNKYFLRPEEIREVTPGGKTIPCALPYSSTNISKRKSRSNEVYLSLSKRVYICFSYFKVV